MDQDLPAFSLWLRAFAVTCAVEIPLVVWALGRLGTASRARRLAVAFLAQALTHPVLWYVVPPPPPEPEAYAVWLILCESGVTLVEGLLFACFVGLVRGLGLSIVANAVTTLLGLALTKTGFFD